MCVTICGRFCPDEGAVAGYGNRIRVKYTAKWGVQIAGMIFQTRSKCIHPEHTLFFMQKGCRISPAAPISFLIFSGGMRITALIVKQISHTFKCFLVVMKLPTSPIPIPSASATGTSVW